MTAEKFIPLAPTLPGPVADTRKPHVNFPAGACDCHAHVFGPQQQYPFWPNRGAGFSDAARLARHPRCRFKLIEPYRLSKQPPMFPEWIPDEAQRKRVLADNPARLYDFK